MRFALAVAGLLAVMAGLMLYVESQESVTFDEPVHIGSGLAFLKTRDYAFNLEHPPLVKAIAAAPLLWTEVELPQPLPQDAGTTYGWALAFVHKNRIAAAVLVRIARLGMMAITLALGALFAWWCRLRFGTGAALTALTLFAFDPAFLAHGHYVTTDVGAALGMFASCALWSLWLERPSPWKLAAVALALGFALTAKFSCVVLLGILPAQALLETRSLRWWRGMLGVFAGAAIVVMLVYAPDGLRVIGPKHLWWRGLEIVLTHNSEGHATYLMGEYRQFGTWRYFPVAFAVKSTLGLLSLVAVSFVALFIGKQRSVPVAIWLPLVVILAAAMMSKLNLGLRHILPAYPFLFALIALAWSRAGRKLQLAMIVLLAAHVTESLAAMPNPIGFFNIASGGMRNGHRWLLDSNLDWGQDLAKVPAWLDSQGLSRKVCLEYFGSGNPENLGLKTEPIPRTWHTHERASVDCLGIISVTLAYDLYLEPNSFRWLREGHKPVAVIGSSLWVYDLRKSRGSTGPLKHASFNQLASFQ